ncbi:hypothetical protein S83_001196 [Arachis hypogaea]|nr:uncharacterized protein DS421_1g12760 [Arachis hypogaea]
MILEVKNGLCVDVDAARAPEVSMTARMNDPLQVRTKGTSRGNDASSSKGPKRRKCSDCGRLGHRRTRCPVSQQSGEIQHDPHGEDNGIQERPSGHRAEVQTGTGQTCGGNAPQADCEGPVLPEGTRKRKQRVNLPSTFHPFIFPQ